ncbi:MAG: aminopeptidase P family N-terminal domain-containing protein [Lachnospirales bacterium]
MINKLRELMKINNIDTYIITKFDPHQSEDSEEYYSSVKFISGFTGSAGTVVVTQGYAGLWTDGRYYIQAKKELNKNIELVKASNPGVIGFLDYAYKNTKTNGKIAFDGETMSCYMVKNLLEKTEKKNITLETNVDFIGELWTNRPSLSKNNIFIHEEKYCGESSQSKIKRVREKMDTDYYIISSLDDIAWLTNLRGSDVENNTFFAAYFVLSKNDAILFIDKDKLDFHVDHVDVEVRDYNEIYDYLKALESENIALKSSSTNYNIFKACQGKKIIELPIDITEEFKAIKNSIEIENLEKVNIRDGVAMVRSIKWVKENYREMDEVDVANKFAEYRQIGTNYVGPSFGTIAAYMSNAAMSHYHPTKENCSKLKDGGFMLVDSGGQYFDGTTDMTRTFSLGNLSDEMKKDFTYVLKSHIAIASAKFPENATGGQIDGITRASMWEDGVDFNHGTGHGLGFFGCVHEGPHNISGKSTRNFPKGILVTNEPGLYKEDKYGIRTENTVTVEDFKSTEFGNFYKFRTISYCPIDIDAIDVSMLNSREIKWVNDYHDVVFSKLKDYLDSEEVEFLEVETRRI